VVPSVATGLLVIALPNRLGESPRFLQFSGGSNALYPAAIRVFIAIGFAELNLLGGLVTSGDAGTASAHSRMRRLVRDLQSNETN
jgi:hypothetical protein